MDPKSVDKLFPNGNNYEWVFGRQLTLDGHIGHHAQLTCIIEGLPDAPYGFRGAVENGVASPLISLVPLLLGTCRISGAWADTS